MKRLHDRDKSGWWIVPFFVLPSLSGHIHGWLGESIVSSAVGLALFILCIWGFIELGFLRGSFAGNLFGPNPLGKQQARSRGTEARPRATTWDQESEIELAPHRASPLSSMHVNRGA
jgi:hypothetical protein